jgi:two-component system LytT family response regulator
MPNVAGRVTDVTCVVVDDEEMARARLRDLLADAADVRVIGEAADGLTAVRCIDALRPDLVFLDIRLPGLTGLQVLERAKHVPAVIFTTAFDEFAVTAFELHALDYLLKPFSGNRLHLALARAREALVGDNVPGVIERATAALSGSAPQRVFVRDRGTLLAVPLSSVERIEGSDDYSALYTNTRRYLVLRRLSELETTLAAARFVRIHRSHIINLAYVAALRGLDGGRVEVEMRSGVRLPASRARLHELKRLVASA